MEVITFDGESHIEEVEAHNADEAQEIAASYYEDVDYTMVQGCYAGLQIPSKGRLPRKGQPKALLICRHCLRFTFVYRLSGTASKPRAAS